MNSAANVHTNGNGDIVKFKQMGVEFDVDPDT
jgi:hypothetical protein